MIVVVVCLVQDNNSIGHSNQIEPDGRKGNKVGCSYNLQKHLSLKVTKQHCKPTARAGGGGGKEPSRRNPSVSCC